MGVATTTDTTDSVRTSFGILKNVYGISVQVKKKKRGKVYDVEKQNLKFKPGMRSRDIFGRLRLRLRLRGSIPAPAPAPAPSKTVRRLRLRLRLRAKSTGSGGSGSGSDDRVLT